MVVKVVSKNKKGTRAQIVIQDVVGGKKSSRTLHTMVQNKDGHEVFTDNAGNVYRETKND